MKSHTERERVVKSASTVTSVKCHLDSIYDYFEHKHNAGTPLTENDLHLLRSAFLHVTSTIETEVLIRDIYHDVAVTAVESSLKNSEPSISRSRKQ